MALAQALYASGWITTYFAPSYLYLLLGRFLSGGGIGIAFPTTNMYLCEISLIRFRGSLAIMNTVAMNCFVAVSLACAATLSFEMLIMVSAIPSLTFLLLVSFLPESPICYAKSGKFDEAKKSLEWIRGAKYDCSEELEEMEKILAIKQDWKASIKEMTQAKSLYPLILMILLMFMQVSKPKHFAFFTLVTFITFLAILWYCHVDCVSPENFR